MVICVAVVQSQYVKEYCMFFQFLTSAHFPHLTNTDSALGT